MKQRKITIMQSSSQKHLYQGEIITEPSSKTTFYDGAGYLFSNETKCFFKGTWKMNEKVCGIETFPNGDVYEGPYQEKKFHGKGLLYNNVRGRYRYEGEFKNGQKDGFGKEEYVSGSTYEGHFRENLKHGQGKLTFTDGSYYHGDFARGSPNGFGIHSAKSKARILTVFPIPDLQSKKDEDDENAEYIYEGDFVDGYKHGIGRLHEPSGSYIYGYWEYNRPVRDIIYYEADGNKWRLINVPAQNDLTLNFYEVLDKLNPEQSIINGGGYPTNNLDGFKRLIDEKGLKREAYVDPEFECSEFQFVINDPATKSHQLAAVDYLRAQDLDIYKTERLKLFPNGIQAGCLKYQEHFCCQQLTCFLDALTYVPHQLRKTFTRKYESKMGFYTLKHFINNQWKEVVLDDYIPVHRESKLPVYSHCDHELGWNILFKSVAKHYKSLNYFDDIKRIRIQEYAKLLTGLPVYQLKVPKTKEALPKFYKQLTKKFDATPVKIAYLRVEQAAKLQINQFYAYHIIDTQLVQANNDIEHTLILVKSMLESSSIIIEYNISKDIEKAAQKLRDRSPHTKNDNRYFIIPIIDFLNYFEDVYLISGSKYSVMNQLQIKPTDGDQYNNDFRFFCKFSLNVPQRILIMLTQVDPVPLRIVLAKDKDYLSHKQRVKKKIINQWKDTAEEIRLSKQQEQVPTQTQISYLAPEMDRKKEKPFRYIFGRGQSVEANIFKDVLLESGTYTILIQAEMTKFTDQTQFWMAIHGYGLAPIHQVPMINNFQTQVYESAIINAEKNKKQPKFYYKGDLSEQENGSSDLIITQYFLKKEGTYLQHFNNRSTNKIWRQKLYFKLENMMIIDQRDNQKLDLQLSKKETALVIIQQVSGQPYNLEGGEGICIIDLLNDQKEEDEEEEGEQQLGTEVRETDQNNTNKDAFWSQFEKRK